MRKSIIVAHDMGRVIGFEGKIPWHLPEDMKRFKELTTGKCVIMGRKTFESIGKPLPKRLNIVVTSDPYAFSDKWIPYYTPQMDQTHWLVAVPSYEEAIKLAASRGHEHVFAIGGTKIYEEALKTADDMYLTVIYHAHEGDTYFPYYDCHKWDVKEVQEFYEEEIPDYSFFYLERKPPGKLETMKSKLAGKFKKASPTKES